MIKTNNITVKIPESIELIKRILSIIVVVFVLSGVAFGQNDSTSLAASDYITGIVRDAKTKEPIAAAQIITLNNKAAATTDENGLFKIKVYSNTDVLLVKAIDYNAIEFPIKEENELVIDLYTDVFTEYYSDFDNITGLKRSSYSTNSANNITKREDLSKTSVDEVLHSSMGGNFRAINHSGTNGIGSSLFIRGLNSINLNSQPLIVVDGVIWNSNNEINSLHDGFICNPIDDIDKIDIESITVVKDGTSIYGSKGSNGVILIKTKRGVDMATKITFNMSIGLMERPGGFPLMDGDEFKVYATDLLSTQGLTPQSIDQMKFLNEDPSSSTYNKFHNATDWEDGIYKNGMYQNVNISVNGGDERALYAFSIGYTGNKGVVNSTDMQRLNTRFNADFFLSDIIDMGLNIGFTNIDRNLVDDGVNFYTSPTYLAMIKSEFLNPYSYTAIGEITTDLEDADVFDVGNPLAIIENSLNTNKHYRLNMGLKPVIKITRLLSLSNQFDYSLLKYKESHYNPVIGTAIMEIPGQEDSENLYQSQLVRDNNFFNDLQLRYNRKIGDNHRTNSIIGIRYIYDSYNSDYEEGHNTGSDQKRDLENAKDLRYISGVNNEVKSLSYYANVDYSFDNRYFLTAVVSVDGSSRFGRETERGFQMFDYSWAVFPSINAAWLVSSEKFMANVPFVNLLKLRTGYGISGNDEYDPYAWSTYFSPIRFMGVANGLSISNIGNSKIQWETTSKLNFGIDLHALNNRVAISADVYNNNTDNLLHLNALPEVAGSGYYWVNGGKMANKGFEVSINTKALNLSKLTWEVGASIGHYKNNITSLPDGDFITNIYDADILSATDNPAGVFFGYKTNGIFATEAEAKDANLRIIDENGNESLFTAGDVHFTDINPDGIIDEKDRQLIGDPNPDFYGAFNSVLTYGNFSFEALFTFSYGNDVYNYLRSKIESGSSFANQSTAMLNRWTYEGQQTDMPKVSYGDPMGNARFSDRWIEDGSYFRLKSLSLSYKVPLQSALFDQLTIWASAKNLVTLTNYLGRDPEFSANSNVLYQGIDTGLIPQTRSYFIGIKLNL